MHTNQIHFNVNPFNFTNHLQHIVELNQKTAKKFSYLDPQELGQLHDPKSLLRKNMDAFIDNSHTGLDYIYQLFNILANFSNEAEEKAKNFIKTTHATSMSSLNKSSGLKAKPSHSQSASHASKKTTGSSRTKNKSQ